MLVQLAAQFFVLFNVLIKFLKFSIIKKFKKWADHLNTIKFGAYSQICAYGFVQSG